MELAIIISVLFTFNVVSTIAFFVNSSIKCKREIKLLSDGKITKHRAELNVKSIRDELKMISFFCITYGFLWLPVFALVRGVGSISEYFDQKIQYKLDVADEKGKYLCEVDKNLTK